jgi:hypothetical protein
MRYLRPRHAWRVRPVEDEMSLEVPAAQAWREVRDRLAAVGRGPVDIWKNLDCRCPLRCRLFVSMAREDPQRRQI